MTFAAEGLVPNSVLKNEVVTTAEIAAVGTDAGDQGWRTYTGGARTRHQGYFVSLHGDFAWAAAGSQCWCFPRCSRQSRR